LRGDYVKKEKEITNPKFSSVCFEMSSCTHHSGSKELRKLIQEARRILQEARRILQESKRARREAEEQITKARRDDYRKFSMYIPEN
jgi:hypothetical protein